MHFFEFQPGLTGLQGYLMSETLNEEQQVLNFFAQAENLPLALSVADQVDMTRQQLNHTFWLELQKRLTAIAPQWQVETTEDRNAAGCLVGLHLEPVQKQALYLRPMLEQQYLGETQRIYFGLMWSAVPTPEASRVNTIVTLRDSLQKAGFKNNENFLAWQWTRYYPRRSDFLLRFSKAPNVLLDEISAMMQNLLSTNDNAVHAANIALRDAPRSAAISLAKLRSKL